MVIKCLSDSPSEIDRPIAYPGVNRSIMSLRVSNVRQKHELFSTLRRTPFVSEAALFLYRKFSTVGVADSRCFPRPESRVNQIRAKRAISQQSPRYL